MDPARKGVLRLLQCLRGTEVLVARRNSATVFADELGITFDGNAIERDNGLEYNGWVSGIKSLYQKAKLSDRAKPFGKIHPDNDI